jgi:hypothetical protein
VHSGTIPLNPRIDGDKITLDLSALKNARERNIALRAVQNLPNANGHPQVEDICLSADGNTLFARVYVTSSSRNTKHIKSTRTLVCKAVRRAVTEHREKGQTPRSVQPSPQPRRQRRHHGTGRSAGPHSRS